MLFILFFSIRLEERLKVYYPELRFTRHNDLFLEDNGNIVISRGNRGLVKNQTKRFRGREKVIFH